MTEIASKHPTHPMQPIVVVNGVHRFKANKIVRHLLDVCQNKAGFDHNQLALMSFSDEDREQLRQLIGYSLSAYGAIHGDCL